MIIPYMEHSLPVATEQQQPLTASFAPWFQWLNHLRSFPLLFLLSDRLASCSSHTVNPFMKNGWVMKGNADGHEFICRPGVQPRFLLAACRAVTWQLSTPGPADNVRCRAQGLKHLVVGAPPVELGTGTQWALGFHPKILVEECVLPAAAKWENRSLQNGVRRSKKEHGVA